MIYGTISGQNIKIADTVTAAETNNTLTAKFTFSKEWERLKKIAYFRKSGEESFPFVLENDCIPARAGLNLTGGEWEISIRGYDLRGSETENTAPRLTTCIAVLHVWETVSPGENEFPEVPKTFAEQILAAAEDAKETAADVERRANAGEFDGKDGAPLTVVSKTWVDSESIMYPDGTHFERRPSYDILTLSDGTVLDIPPGTNGYNGSNGKDGKTPYVGANGNWWLPVQGLPPDRGTDTGNPSRGEDGTSISIVNISESTESGGVSTVTFSDGSTLSVRNGRDGQGGGSDVTKETVKEWGFVDESELETVTHKTFKIYPTFSVGGVGTSGGTTDATNRCRIKSGASMVKLTGRLTVTPADGWEFGVYLYRTATYSAQSAISSTGFSATPTIVEQSAEGYYAAIYGRKVDGSTVTENEVLAIDEYVTIELTVTDDAMRQVGDVSMYQRWAVCGASRDAGYVYKTTASNSNVTIPSLAWGKISARNHGNDCRIYAVKSRTSYGFADLNTTSDDDARLKKLLAEEAKELYVVALGMNDDEEKFGSPANLHDTLEEYTAADRATTWGALGYIILAIKAHAPEAHIIGILRDDGDEIPENHTKCVIANRIFRHFELPFADWFNADEGHTYIAPDSYRYGHHPVGTGYAQMARGFDEIYRLMVLGYWSYFSHFTGYTYSSGGTEVTEETVSGWGFTKFDGDYNSLSNKPSIPAAVTDQHIVDVIAAAYPNAEGVGF